MSLGIFIHAFTATFAMLCVIGPICMTVINTTMIYGFCVGIFAGIGVAVADSIYIIVASFAIAVLEGILKSKIVILIGLFGGIFLYYLAYKFWYTKPVLKGEKISRNQLKSFITLFCLTLTGPTTILTYSVVFSSFLGTGNFNAISAILGGISATFLFYLLLVGIISMARKKMNDKSIIILNRFAASIIAILATILVANAVKELFV